MPTIALLTSVPNWLVIMRATSGALLTNETGSKETIWRGMGTKRSSQYGPSRERLSRMLPFELVLSRKNVPLPCP